MAKYRVLIVDDEMSSNKKFYDNLFGGDADFSMDIAESWLDFIGKRLNEFDAILLDVNLDHWGKTLHDAFNVLNGRCPVLLVSQWWHEPRTHQHISNALAGAKHVVLAGTLTLNYLGSPGWEGHASSMLSQLRLVIARHRQHGLLDLRDNDPIRILHLSDPQYGDPNEDNLAFLVEKEIPKFVMDTLRLNVHFIAVTGDITFSGQPSEFARAKEKLKVLVNGFMPNREDWRERLLLVPGNHDVDLQLAAADWIRFDFGNPQSISPADSSIGEEHQHYGLQAFRDFAWELSKNPYWRDADDLLWINDSFRHLGIRFYILNSVSEVGFANPKKYRIPPDTLDNMIESVSSNDDLFGVILAHHGPVVAGTDPSEGIENWSQVLKTIQNAKVRLFIHGHGHARLADIVPLSDERIPRAANGLLDSQEILRVMAPTTHLDGKKRPDGERRGFNLITLERQYGNVEKVRVDSYVLSGNQPHRAKDAKWEISI